MKIAHFSDTHLGYRRDYSRLAPNGQNQREVDVFQTFERVLEDISDSDPDIILHTGDFFDMIRPGNHTIVNAYRRLMDLQLRRCKPFIIIAGNHETPRRVQDGCILSLFEKDKSGGIPWIYTAIESPRWLELDGVNILCIPYIALPGRDEWLSNMPAGDGSFVLAVHGLDATVKSCAHDFYFRELRPDNWDYIALGDYHIRKELQKNAIYCGSTDFTSSNIWEEVETKKGWILFDTETKCAEFHPVEPVRRVLDLPAIDAAGLSGTEIAEAISRNADWHPAEMPIVRQRIINLQAAVRREIPAHAERDARSRALYYILEPSYARSEQTAGTYGGAGRSLTDDWSEYCKNRDAFPQGVTREEYTQSGLSALKEAAGVSSEA